MSSLDAEDLIFYSDKENNIYSGGFNVNSIIMKNGLSPIVTLNQKGGDKTNNVSDLFQHLVVPNWTFTLPFKKSYSQSKSLIQEEEEEEEEDSINEDLHSKLLSLIKPFKEEKINKKTSQNIKTKKNIKIVNN